MSVVSLVVRRAARDSSSSSSTSEASLTLRPSSSLDALKAAVRQAFAPELDGQVRRRQRHRQRREIARVTRLFSFPASACFFLPPFFSAFYRSRGAHGYLITPRPKNSGKKHLQQFELTDLSSPPLADDAAATRVLSRASECAPDASAVLWVVSSGTQALGGVTKVMKQRERELEERREEEGEKQERRTEKLSRANCSLLSEACVSTSTAQSLSTLLSSHLQRPLPHRHNRSASRSRRTPRP